MADKTLLDLKPSDCRFPIGKNDNDEHTFCARRKEVGIDYCTEHARVMFQPQTGRGGFKPSPKPKLEPFVAKAI